MPFSIAVSPIERTTATHHFPSYHACRLAKHSSFLSLSLLHLHDHLLYLSLSLPVFLYPLSLFLFLLLSFAKCDFWCVPMVLLSLSPLSLFYYFSFWNLLTHPQRCWRRRRLSCIQCVLIRKWLVDSVLWERFRSKYLFYESWRWPTEFDLFSFKQWSVFRHMEHQFGPLSLWLNFQNCITYWVAFENCWKPKAKPPPHPQISR